MINLFTKKNNLLKEKENFRQRIIRVGKIFYIEWEYNREYGIIQSEIIK